MFKQATEGIDSSLFRDKSRSIRQLVTKNWDRQSINEVLKVAAGDDGISDLLKLWMLVGFLVEWVGEKMEENK